MLASILLAATLALASPATQTSSTTTDAPDDGPCTGEQAVLCSMYCAGAAAGCGGTVVSDICYISSGNTAVCGCNLMCGTGGGTSQTNPYGKKYLQVVINDYRD
jgi:hypothetical protein